MKSAEKVSVGLVTDLRNPPGWERPASQMYGAALDRIQEAERLGIESIWTSEHHLWIDGHLTQPLTYAAAIAARTTRMRIGTSIMNGAIRKPIDLAEQAIVVDLISGGRLELGLGAGYDPAELEAYGVDYSQRLPLLRQNVRELIRLWEDGGVTPRPVQERLPLWIGAAGPKGIAFAASVNAGLVGAGDGPVATYLEALDDPADARCIDMPNLFIADDPDEVWPILASRMAWVSQAYSLAGADRTSGLSLDVESLRQREGIPAHSSIDVVTPDEALRRIEPWVKSRPLTHIQFALDVAGLPDHLLDRQIELIAENFVGAFDRVSGAALRGAL